jgi:glycerophosphoryl diester phosphodiesterase
LLIAQNNSPLIIGHRGASAIAPENTLAAFARAVHDGAAGIELDVRLSHDGVPVVIHDATLPRTRLRKRFVGRLPLARIKEVDAGSWFNERYPSLASSEYTSQTIPTLDEVFALLAGEAPKGFLIYVELKCGPSSKRNEELAKAAIAAVRRFDLMNQAIVISFNLRTVATVKQLDSSIRTGAMFGPRTAVRSPSSIVKAAVACGADEILLNHRIVTQKLVSAAAARDLPTVVWTVDDPRWLARARTLRIFALMTNDPARMIQDSSAL